MESFLSKYTFHFIWLPAGKQVNLPFFFFLAVPGTCGNSQAGNGICTTAVTPAIAVTMQLYHKGTPVLFFFKSLKNGFVYFL